MERQRCGGRVSYNEEQARVVPPYFYPAANRSILASIARELRKKLEKIDEICRMESAGLEPGTTCIAISCLTTRLQGFDGNME